MNIFFWFLIIAAATLAANLAVILYMGNKRRRTRLAPIICMHCAGYAAAGLLYAAASANGTQILEQRQAAVLSVDTDSFRRSRGDDGEETYTFNSAEGVPFSFGESCLLQAAPDSPKSVEIYDCRTRTGFSACYLEEGESVMYLLK